MGIHAAARAIVYVMIACAVPGLFILLLLLFLKTIEGQKAY